LRRNPFGIRLAAFTLVEILVTITLLAFIVLGLFAMFNQVQRAFRSSMNQVDQLEAGRAVTGLLPAELEQITPCGAHAVTFYAQIIGSSVPTSAPLTQNLPGTATPAMQRTNLLEDCFILQRQNQTWVGIGYCVRTNDSAGRLWYPETGPGSGQLGVGSLYRFSITTNVLGANGLPNDPRLLYVTFANDCANGSAGSQAISNRICDGVIHFYLQAFATNGYPIMLGTRSNANAACFYTNALTPYSPYYGAVYPVDIVKNTSCPGNQSALRFWSNAVPASVELQLGMLEQHALDRYNAIGDPTARLNYLQRDDNTSRVHLFRQRVQMRSVNPLAYQ
jgi:Tfp pilus assembly protein PilW